MAQLVCTFCEEPVDPQSGFRKVSGFERLHREGGGTNAVALRKPEEVFACRWCIDKQGRGISPEQETLL